MNGPDTSRRASDLPELLHLTEEERQNGLALFAAEAAAPPERQPTFEPHQTFEHVPAYGKAVVYTGRGVGRAIPDAVPIARPSLTRQVSLLAAGLTAVLLVLGILSVSMMHPSDEGRVGTVTAGIPATPAVDVRPSVGIPMSTAAPVSNGVEERRDAASQPDPEVTAQPAAVLPAAVSRERRAAAVAAVPSVAAAESARTVESALLVEPAPVVEPAIALAPLPQRPEPVTLVAEARPVPAVSPTAPVAETSTFPAPSAPPPEIAIQTVLTRYRTAYRDLDAGAALAVWPSVDAKALRRAFANLEQQNVTFDSCQIEIRNLRAVASCRGLVSYVPRVGNKDLRDDRRQWEFALSKVDDAWLIDKVSAR